MSLPVVRLLCAKEVAEILGTSERTAARLMRTHEIKAFKLSNSVWRTTGGAVGEYILRELERREALTALRKSLPEPALSAR